MADGVSRKYEQAKIAEVRERIKKMKLEIAIKEGRLVDKEELFRELAPRMDKIRKLWS
jgi:hypothetical protein